MTDPDKHDFLRAFNRLSIAQREKKPDAVILRTYFEALQDLEIELVTAAVDRLLRANYFPKVSEWRDAVEKVTAERLEAQRAFLRKLPAPLCQLCGDTGWANQPAMDDKDNTVRVARCGCQDQRRAELLGRAPVPQLPPAAVDAEPEQGQP